MNAETKKRADGLLEDLKTIVREEYLFRLNVCNITVQIKYNNVMKKYFAEIVEQRGDTLGIRGQTLGTGSTATEALGSLVWAMPELFGVKKIRYANKDTENMVIGEHEAIAEGM